MLKKKIIDQYPLNQWDVIYNPPAGFSVDITAEAVLKQAKKKEKTLSFLFNGTHVYVDPKDTIESIVKDYWKQRG